VTSSGREARDAQVAGAISLPTRSVSPLTAVTRRMLLAAGLLVLCTLIVYLGRKGYHDNAHPGRLTERTVDQAEVGRGAREVAGAVIAVLRDQHLLAADDPGAERLQAGDRLILIASADGAGQR
jgi:hypothetical protein